MNIAIIICLVEMLSIIVKKFKPEWTKFLPVANTAIGVSCSLVMHTDILAGLAAAGLSCAGYDLIHGLLPKKEEEKCE